MHFALLRACFSSCFFSLVVLLCVCFDSARHNSLRPPSFFSLVVLLLYVCVFFYSARHDSLRPPPPPPPPSISPSRYLSLVYSRGLNAAVVVIVGCARRIVLILPPSYTRQAFQNEIQSVSLFRTRAFVLSNTRVTYCCSACVNTHTRECHTD